VARIDDIPEATRTNIVALDCPTPTTHPFVQGPPLHERTVAILSTAALTKRGDPPFMPGTAEVRELSASLPSSEILMSHVSVNYDRQGWQRDINTIYPIDRLRELTAEGVIRGVADTHFTVMGSTDPKLMEEAADSIVARMKRDRIGSILACPV
jgi:D-proline reductase (dithiol) PrdB